MHSNGKEISLNLTRYISTFAKHATDLILMSLLDQTESFLMSSLLSNADAKSCPKVIPDACRCQFAKNIDKLRECWAVLAVFYNKKAAVLAHESVIEGKIVLKFLKKLSQNKGHEQ